MIKIGLVSDIHLEFRNNYKNILKMKADVLCLAGDICPCGTEEDYKTFTEFLTFVCPKYKYIIHVPGNHEYYTSGAKEITIWNTMNEINKRLKKLRDIFPNYIFLNGEVEILIINEKKCAFIGATLWTKINVNDYKTIENNMNDYSHIYVGKIPRKITVKEVQQIHNKHVAFIAMAIKKFNKIPCVLVTHHKPVKDSTESDVLTQAYETDITPIIKNIKYAFHGHTHKHYDKIINGVRYLANPKGYYYQHTEFIDDLVVTL